MEYDLSMLKKLAGDDERFIVDMLLTFKRTSPPIVQRMVELVAERKYEALGREAHKLIPGVSFLGASKLKNILVDIEEGVKNSKDPEKIHTDVAAAKELVAELIVIFEKDYNLEQES